MVPGRPRGKILVAAIHVRTPGVAGFLLFVRVSLAGRYHIRVAREAGYAV